MQREGFMPASMKRGCKKRDEQCCQHGVLLVQVCTICLAAGVFDPRADRPRNGPPLHGPKERQSSRVGKFIIIAWASNIHSHLIYSIRFSVAQFLASMPVHKAIKKARATCSADNIWKRAKTSGIERAAPVEEEEPKLKKRIPQSWHMRPSARSTKHSAQQ